jgi:enterochelin esterase-like enzyme
MEALRFSIVSGWFPVVLLSTTVTVSVIAVILRRGVLMEFALGIPAGVVLLAVLLAILHFEHAVPRGTPRSLSLWLGVACLMIGLVVAGWRTAHWTHRVFGVAAIVLAAASAGSSVNQAFQYYPTLARLLGKNANHFVDDAELDALRGQVARTGRLPTHGATLSVAISGANLNFKPRAAFVWLPPAWFARDQPHLPVIELLHGTPGGPSDWTRAGYADATSLAFAELHGGQAPVLVMPDINGSFTGDTECVNSRLFGDVETYLTRDVPRFMETNFNTRATRGSWAIAGLSEGGTCATTLALNHPSLYSTFASYSGFASPTYQDEDTQRTVATLFNGSMADYDAHDPPSRLARSRFAGMAGWFESGTEDTDSLQAARTLQAMASRAGVDTCYASPPGSHDFAFWRQALSDSLPWLSWRVGLTSEPQSLAARCVPGSS